MRMCVFLSIVAGTTLRSFFTSLFINTFDIVGERSGLWMNPDDSSLNIPPWGLGTSRRRALGASLSLWPCLQKRVRACSPPVIRHPLQSALCHRVGNVFDVRQVRTQVTLGFLCIGARKKRGHNRPGHTFIIQLILGHQLYCLSCGHKCTGCELRNQCGWEV